MLEGLIKVFGVRVKPTSSIRKVLFVLVFCCASLSCHAQEARPQPVQSARWVLEYDDSLIPSQQREHGVSRKQIWNDPRFRLLLKASFKNQPAVWKDVLEPWQSHVPVMVVDGRYAIIEGCPVHECGYSNWFLWIDTQSDSLDLLHANVQLTNKVSPEETAKYALLIVGSQPHRDNVGPVKLHEKFLETLQAWFSGKEPFDDGSFNGGNRSIVTGAFEGPNRISIPLPAASLRRFNVSASSSK